MKDLPELQAAFGAVDDLIDNQAGAAWHRRRLINQEAYFVLAWAQFEREVDDACRDLIRRRRAETRWELRRGFDIYNPDDKRLAGLSFDERLSFVLDRDSPEIGRARAYYTLRNAVAHGTAFATGIDFEQIVPDLFAIFSTLSR